jgi:type IV secretory pathway VirB2 component (pilin)
VIEEVAVSSCAASNRRQLLLAVGITAIAALLLALLLPDIAEAALRNAAGGGNGGGGFGALTRYLDRLASYLIPVGGAAAVLGLIAGGFMFMGGNPGAQRVLGYVALGVVIVLASKGLAA